MMLLTTVTCVLLFAHLDTGHCETYDEFVERTLEQWCPYDQFCSQHARKNLTNPKRRSCCLPCSCDTTCITRNNCCPDYIHMDDHMSRKDTDDHTARKQTCLSATLFKGLANPMFDGEYLGIHFYYTVDSCPSLYPDEAIVTKCTAPIPEDFIGAVRVSDATGQVYKNRYCAICHGVTDYKTWELRTILNTRMLTVDVTKLNISALLDHNVLIVSLPPPDHKSVMPRCYRPDIVTCNQTGYSTLFNSYLHKACNEYTNNYIGHIGLAKVVTKNLFCYLCNKGTNNKMYDSCEVDDGSDKTSFGKFSAIIDIDRVPTVHTTHGKHACKQDEILDPYFAVCKPLFCPIGTQPSYGRCVSLYKMSLGLALRFPVAFNVTINGDAESADRPLQIETREHAEAIDKIIIQKFGLSAKKCMFCFSKFYQFDDPEIFGTPRLLIAEFITTQLCTTGDMLDTVVNNIDGQQVLESLDNMNITVTTALHYGLSSKFYHVIHTIKHGGYTFDTGLECIGGLLIRLPKFHCPNLGLTYREYQQVLSGNVSGSPATYEDFLVDDIPDGQGENGSMYKICVKDYLRQENSGSGSKSPLGGLELSALVMLYGIIA